MSKHRVLNTAISYPTSADVIARLIAGEQIPIEERGMVTRVAGDIVDDIPDISVEHLIAEGAIEAVADEAAWQDLGRPTDDDTEKAEG